MADDKKNIPDAGKVDNPPEPGKVEPAKADPPVQDQPASAKADASVVEGAPKVATPPAAEQPAPADKEAPKDMLPGDVAQRLAAGKWRNSDRNERTKGSETPL